MQRGVGPPWRRQLENGNVDISAIVESRTVDVAGTVHHQIAIGAALVASIQRSKHSERKAAAGGRHFKDRATSSCPSAAGCTIEVAGLIDDQAGEENPADSCVPGKAGDNVFRPA